MRRTSLPILVALVTAALPVLAAAQPQPRFTRGTDQRARVTRPPASSPPQGLAPARPTATRKPSPDDAEVENQGLATGALVADHLARTEGWSEVYRVGVYAGQRAALEDRELGRWGYEQGIRAGQLDPEARTAGALEGSRAAREAAANAAPGQVERQFLDLEWTPVPTPLPERAAFEPEFAPTPEPELESIFADYPLERVPAAPQRMLDNLTGSSWTPSRLHACSSWQEVDAAEWRDADRAFRFWVSDTRRSAYWRRLESERQRALFQAAFVDAFLERSWAAYESLLADAYRAGFEDGWSYGAFVRAEWSYRQGYVRGFDEALALSATTAFEREYPPAYLLAYGAAFHDWMESAHPAILSASLRDGNDDGVFQPGETVELDYLLANYGGAGQTFELSVEGAPLLSSASTPVHLAARDRQHAVRPLVATLEAGIRTPSHETLVLRVATERRDLPLRVAYPMEFTGTISYESRPLAQTAAVRFEVSNRSRKPLERVSVVVEGPEGTIHDSRRLLGRVEAGQTLEAGFELENVSALDLLGGTLTVRAAVESDSQVEDRKEARFPDKASRLDDPDLVLYLLRLGRDRDPDPAEVAGARRLLLRRLESDWSERVGEDGNAYEQDARDRGTRTALGELVRAYEGERSALRSSRAWSGLDRDVVGLAERLPGIHPNLRRWMRKLATRLA